MSAYKAVILRCDHTGCLKKIVLRVTTTAGGVHEARGKARLSGWSWNDFDGDLCPTHA